MPIKLLFVVNVDWFFVSHRLNIARAALAAGYEVHLATGCTGLKQRISASGINVHCIRIHRSSSNPLENFRTLVALIRLFLSLKPQIVHLVTIKPLLLGGLAAKFAGIRFVVGTVSGLGSAFICNDFVSRIRRLFLKILYRIVLDHQSLRIIYQNESDRDYISNLMGMNDTQSMIIRGSGVNLQQYSMLPEATGIPVVLMAARLIHDKGVVEFFQAAKKLQDDGVIARFCLAGDIDPGNPSSLSLAERDRLAQDCQVELLGFQEDMPSIISSASIVVLPSYREGFPKVLIEAAACGRSVVTTDVPGCRDAIISGVTGLLVPVRDKDALATAIGRLLADSNLRNSMGAAARRLAELEFDENMVIKAHISTYQALIGSFDLVA